jgi:3D (Asp-Asp-Asp) domain-containing protein
MGRSATRWMLFACAAFGCAVAPSPTPPVAKRATVGFALRVRATHYFAGETHSDPDTDAGRSATGVPLRTATAARAGICAVDPAVIPYGSRVTVQTADGPRSYLAADTGGAVIHRTASHGTAPVIAFYSAVQVGGEYAVVTVVPYVAAIPFLRLTAAQRADVLATANPR